MAKVEKKNNEGLGPQSGKKRLELSDLLDYFAGLNSKPVIMLGESGIVGLNKPGQEIVEEIKQDRNCGCTEFDVE